MADSDLPCQFEKFYSAFILPARPAGTSVDVKKSGYKKLAKLLSTWEKKGALATKAVHKQARGFNFKSCPAFVFECEPGSCMDSEQCTRA